MLKNSLIFISAVLMLACGNQQENESLASTDAQQWIPGWQQTSKLPGARAGAAALIANGYMYLIGGVDGRVFLRTTSYAKINQDGSLGNWKNTSLLNEDRGFIDAVFYKGYIYVVGGGNGPNGKHLLSSAERAKVLKNGELGPWEMEKNGMITPRRCSKLTIVDNVIYSFGGFAGALLDTVERATIQQNGHLGQWQIEPETMTIPRYVNAVKAVKEVSYVIGGHDQNKGVGITNVEWAKPSSDSSMKDWKTTASLKVGRYGLSSAAHNGYVYAIGGLSGLEYLNTIEKTKANNNGELSAWQYTTPLSVPRATFNVLTHKDWIYVIGGSNQDSYLSNVEYALINDQGDIGFWGNKQQANAYAQTLQTQAAKKRVLPNQGKVKHIQQASMYTYVYVQSNLGDAWIAGPKTELKIDDQIQFSKGVSMSNFFSKELQKNFVSILFVGNIEKVN